MHFFWCKAGIVCSQLYYCCSKSFLFNFFILYIYIVSADTICVAQVPGIQGGSTGARSSRYRLCGVWDRHAGWSCQGGSAGFQDYTIQCHEDHLCQEIGMQQVYNWDVCLKGGGGGGPTRLKVCLSMCVAHQNDKSWYLPHELMGAECKCYTVYILKTFFTWLLVALHCGWAVRHCTLPLEVGDNLVRVASPWHCTARWSVSIAPRPPCCLFIVLVFGGINI